MRINGHDEIVRFQFIFKGMMIILYFGEPIAIIDEDGEIIMRDDSYPLYLVNFLVEEMNMHCFWLN